MRPCIMAEYYRHFVVSLFLALILKFLTKYGNINSIYHSDKMILSFSMKIYNFLGLIQIWVEWHMDGCPFRFAFKYGFNLPAKFLAYSNEK